MRKIREQKVRGYIDLLLSFLMGVDTRFMKINHGSVWGEW